MQYRRKSAILNNNEIYFTTVSNVDTRINSDHEPLYIDAYVFCTFQMTSRSILTRLLLTSALFYSYVTGSTDDCKMIHDVAIVGGGPGGAYSAYSLRNSGQNIGLYEYSNRIGGRTFNYRLPNAPDVILQLGGMRWVEGHHVKFQKLTEDLGLEKIVFTEGQGRPSRTRYYLRGYSLSYDEVRYGRIPYGLTAEESQNQHRITEFFFEKLTGFKEEDIAKQNLTAHDIFSFKVADGRYLYQLSMNEALDLVASPEGKAFFEDTSKFYSSFDKDATCIIEFVWMFEKGGGEVYTLVEGMESLARRLIQEFLKASQDHQGQHVLRRNSQLTSIAKTSDNMYKLSFMPTKFNRRLQKNVVLDFKQPMNVCARQVILAVPMFALKQIDWQPLKEGVVADALGSYLFPTASKVFMTFSKPWWLESYPNHYVNIGDKKSSYSQMYDWKQSNVTGDYILMPSYADGFKARYLHYLQSQGPNAPGSARGSHQVTNELRDALLDDLAAALDVPRENIPAPITSVAQFWSGYPFGSGWLGQKAGYNFDDVTRVLRRPSLDDNVFVVGSDYSWGDDKHWTEGALSTVDIVMEEYFKSYQSEVEQTSSPPTTDWW